MKILKCVVKLTARSQFANSSLRLSAYNTRSYSNMLSKSSYRMPVESGKHASTVMIFPSQASMDGAEFLDGAQSEIASIANAISQYQPVHLYTRPELISKAESMVKRNVNVRAAAVDQLWVRDSGPVFVKDVATQQPAAIDFNFNYWGSKLPSTGDEQAARLVTEAEGVTRVQTRLRVEGGAIEHDGEGTFLAAESCIINDNRNPSMTKQDIEAELTATLGVTNFIWVPGVKGKDITDWHIDAMARFAEPGVVILSKPAPGSPEHAIKVYKEAREILSKSKDAQGRSLTVHDCQEPDLSLLGPPEESNEVVASYANYLLVNGAVIMSKFGQKEADENAYQLFKRLFPSREVVQVMINFLPRSGGGIHCATQQVPA